MILCPNCLHQEMIGSLFCTECGAQLIFESGVPTENIAPAPPFTKAQDFEKEKLPFTPQPKPPQGVKVALNILISGDILPITRNGEVTLGRISEGQPVIPDIDLTPYKAFENGVSRMHASMNITDEQITVTDLGSSNGTRINGKIINSNIPYPLKHGDVLTLGRFKIQVLTRKQ